MVYVERPASLYLTGSFQIWNEPLVCLSYRRHAEPWDPGVSDVRLDARLRWREGAPLVDLSASLPAASGGRCRLAATG